LAWRAAADASELSRTAPHKWDPNLFDEGHRDAIWARWLAAGAALAGAGGVTVLIITRRPADPAQISGQRQMAALVGWSTDF